MYVVSASAVAHTEGTCCRVPRSGQGIKANESARCVYSCELHTLTMATYLYMLTLYMYIVRKS